MSLMAISVFYARLQVNYVDHEAVSGKGQWARGKCIVNGVVSYSICIGFRADGLTITVLS